MFVVRFFHLSLQIFKPSLVNAKLSDKVNKVDARMCGWSVFHPRDIFRYEHREESQLSRSPSFLSRLIVGTS